jgi:hypothetical protein
MSFVFRSLLAGSCALLLSCGQTPPEGKAGGPAALSPEPEAFAWPSGFNVMGDGYPRPGDPCRRLGESALTVNYLDDSALLVGCPGISSDSATLALVTALGGQAVGAAEGVTLVSIPQGDANAGMDGAPEAEDSAVLGAPQ